MVDQGYIGCSLEVWDSCYFHVMSFPPMGEEMRTILPR